MGKPFGLGRKEKLKSRKQIDLLFAKGKSFPVPPLRVTYIFSPRNENPGAAIGVTASKRNFKKAVDRNRIKRLLREAYRLQKGPLVEDLKQSGTRAEIFFMFTDKSPASFETVKTAMKQCLERLQKKRRSLHEEAP